LSLAGGIIIILFGIIPFLFITNNSYQAPGMIVDMMMGG
jgi:hypothetical protein